MNSKILFVSAGGILVIALTFSFLISSVNSSPDSSSSTNLEACQTLYYNGDDRINLLFFGNSRQVKEYADYLLSSEPFIEKRESFNVYYIDEKDYSPDCGNLYKGVAILCHSKDLIKKAASCPNDYIFVLKEADPKIRSTAYQQVATLNTNVLPTVILHEFGHLFANLAEEYVPARLSPSAQNCQAECADFELSDGCFEGCSRTNYYRSIENGVMRSLLSKDFGKLNNALISKKIIENQKSSLTGLAISDIDYCNEEEYFLIEGVVEYGQITITEKTLEKGCLGSNGEGYEKYQLISSEGLIIFEGRTQINQVFTETQLEGDSQITGEIFTADDQQVFFRIPSNTGAEIINFVDESGISIGKTNLFDIGGRACQI